MSSTLPPGPFKTIVSPDGTAVPFYIVPFDNAGRCSGPRTREHLLAALRDGDFTDVLVFSHGWNNDWRSATTRYDDFIVRFMRLRERMQLKLQGPWRPLLVGVFWPSTALVFGEDERGPDIAGGDAGVDEATLVDEARKLVSEIATSLEQADAERLYDFLQRDKLNDREASELATLVLTGLAADDELGQGAAAVEDLVAGWRAAEAATAPDRAADDGDGLDDFGTVGASGLVAGGRSRSGVEPDGGSDQGARPETDGGPAAAGVGDALSTIRPRNVLRTLTVWRMKDRAGVVGTNGVGGLWRDVLTVSNAAIHGIGHSYGAKVLLSAVAAAEPPRQATSLLLLQPAVSHLCFAPAGRIPGTQAAGGYHRVPSRVQLPIVTTYSSHDLPLHKTFHLALRRAADLGEQRVAAPGEPPSRYAALGGYGPREAGEELRDMPAPGGDLRLGGTAPIIALDGAILNAEGRPLISGHGDVVSDATSWVLYSLIAASRGD